MRYALAIRFLPKLYSDTMSTFNMTDSSFENYKVDPFPDPAFTSATYGGGMYGGGMYGGGMRENRMTQNPEHYR